MSNINNKDDHIYEVLKSIPNKMLMINFKTEIVFTDIETEKLFEYNRFELIGKKLEILIPERFRFDLNDYIKLFLMSRSNDELGKGKEIIGFTKNNKEIPIEMILNIIKIKNEQYILASFVDLVDRNKREDDTQRKNIEMDLSFDRYNIIEAVPKSLLIVNKQCEIIFINKQTEKLFEYDRNELSGKKLELLIPEKFRIDHFKYMEGYLSNPYNQDIGIGHDLFGLTKSGVEIPIEIKLSHVNITNKDCILVLMIDATERKILKLNLEKKNIELELFVNTVAHDLNSILSESVNYAEILENEIDELDKKTRHEYLNIVSTSSRKMCSIIRELLLFASIGKKAIKYSVIDTKYMVNQICKRFSKIINEKKVKIIIPDTFVECSSYGPWIEQVWLNYINNAIKYGNINPIVEIGSECVDDFVKFWVKDNGHGLTKEEQIEIFKLQDNQTVQHNIIKGHGIGLSIVSRIVTKLDGYTEVESTVGGGSIFSFYLPITK